MEKGVLKKTQTPNPEPQTLIPKPKPLNPKPQTLNSLNPKPQTLNKASVTKRPASSTSSLAPRELELRFVCSG